MDRIYDIVMYGLLGALVVLVVLNADKVAKLIATGGNAWIAESTLLSGQAVPGLLKAA